mgnify:CR=1 FL=1
MKIATYCITFPEEYEIIRNMVGQAKRLGDVFLFDGGMEYSLCRHPTPDLDKLAIAKVAADTGCHYDFLPWPGNPGAQRNAALEALAAYDYDWIIHNDSDELWTNEAVEAIPDYLASLPDRVTNVQVKVLPLVEDEAHYAPGYAHHLVHGRIHRPGTVKWGETWHEHQTYTGERVKSDLWLVHTNWLFLNRLRRIKGHGLEGWESIEVADYDLEYTWPELVYPWDDA